MLPQLSRIERRFPKPRLPRVRLSPGAILFFKADISKFFIYDFYNKAKIAKKVANTPIFKDDFVSCIKIDPYNEGDINALKDVAEFWEYEKLTTNIYYAACAMKNESKYYKHNQIFALTKQDSGFDNLDSNKILGLVQVSPFEDNSLFIERIEVMPEIVSANERELKGLGTAIINYLKTITDKISCFPSNTEPVKNFYYKNGFKEFMQGTNLFVWFK